jgi:antitoxin component YwqK of YwqJK toxin-antitoxin module
MKATLLTWYYESGQLKEEKYCVDGKRHRLDAPAVTKYYESGQLKEESYFVDGKIHRLDAPAVTKYYESGQLKEESYWVDGKDITNELTNAHYFTSPPEMKAFIFSMMMASD